MAHPIGSATVCALWNRHHGNWDDSLASAESDGAHRGGQLPEVSSQIGRPAVAMSDDAERISEAREWGKRLLSCLDLAEIGMRQRSTPILESSLVEAMLAANAVIRVLE